MCSREKWSGLGGSKGICKALNEGEKVNLSSSSLQAGLGLMAAI